MGVNILNVENSFVTFYDPETDLGKSDYITNTECGIQKGFCYPIYDEKDLLFQTSFISTSVLTDASFLIYRDDVLLTGVAILVEQIGLYMGATPIYNVYFSFFSSDLTSGLSDGDCFNLEIKFNGIGFPTFVSNQCFKKINDKCFTSKMVYLNLSDAFGFNYSTVGGSKRNAIRLPLYFKEPNNPGEREVYTRSNGTRKTLSARVDKTYKAYIDEVLEETHQKLVIGMSHDIVRFVPENYSNINGFECIFDNEYNQNFPTIMQNVDIWSADFIIFVTPFNNVNTNCG